MIPRNLLILLVVAGSSAAVADGPSTGPVIDDYGPTYAIEWRDVELPEDHHYKLVFDLAADPEAGQVNRHLVSVARYLNMHARNGVRVEQMSLAVVVHGRALRNLLRNDVHQEREGIGNPNLDLIRSLQEAGVRFYVCGQSMAFTGVAKVDLADGIEVALSAMTMLTLLQADGFALLPWGAG
jgi:intracellular sulfur oxidation DsrE/DsrF family protein